MKAASLCSGIVKFPVCKVGVKFTGDVYRHLARGQGCGGAGRDSEKLSDGQVHTVCEDQPGPGRW